MNPITEALLLVFLSSRLFVAGENTPVRSEKAAIVVLTAFGFGRAAWLLIHAALVLVGVL